MNTVEREEHVSAKPARRRLGPLGTALDRRLNRLQDEYLRGSPVARAELAKLRRGLGKPAGDVPAIWDSTIAAVPVSLRGSDDFGPSIAEQATHSVFTLFAAHQQSMTMRAHVEAVSFGRAVGMLAQAEGRSAEAVTRRFMAVATAQSIDEVLTHIRGLVTQLRTAKQGFDYARLADDLAGLLTPGRAQRVRLAWGREFYRTPSASDTEPEPAQP
ncbi:type I-E CRISPR-associated protein Cse2/CasB [Nocardia brasiliensis]|uniref:type I-E CRISPR-associated protein Cse2/CasB n=1 Tax=Nocardia brasiliensis TaxID=37326 RepID=UPI001894A334|nr:type I-E CRISPR-associated protein Cse2/CasB [Nocardia brasiliensis]MBF6125568.1 type I-E CRISPR-associated protein Cse2/CasB [Nocardia brasiliensis]